MLPRKTLNTFMVILAHINLPKAQKLALSLDIPFWPQLPHFRFRAGYEKCTLTLFEVHNSWFEIEVSSSNLVVRGSS